MISELARLDTLASEMTRRANAAGVHLIWRTQSRWLRRVLIRNGKPEVSTTSSSSGHGVQVVTSEGHTVLASRDDFLPEPALALLDRSIQTAAHGKALGLTRAAFPDLEPLRAQAVRDEAAAPPDVDLGDVVKRLAELEREVAGRVPGSSLQLSYRSEGDLWRIVRSDGTDVSYGIPRSSIGIRATSAGDGARHGVSATVFSTNPRLLWEEATLTRFFRRAERAARLAQLLPDAPAHPAGSFPLVIDYALAKGLAHEAFGHASEADSFRSSILARDGRYRIGDEVGAAHVSIIDEPIEEDHAWQPFSANGLRRERAVIVDHGRLRDGLSDPWSAEAGGVTLTGSARAETYRHAPQPRMTNIRIEVDDPLPAPGEFEEYGPEEVHGLLQNAGVFRRHPRVCFLSGYSGGQVNTASGDFVFNCKAIYLLGPEAPKLYKPAIFSGSMIGALHALREAFGPLRLDATGYCGKWGQSVPSSGGSHYFLVLDPDPTVRLGGS